MPGLLRGVARTAAIAGTATAVSNRVSRRQAGRWAAQDQAAQYEAAPYGAPQYEPAPAPAVPAPLDPSSRLDQLEQLARLRDQGVLSDAEVAAEKARILGT